MVQSIQSLASQVQQLTAQVTSQLQGTTTSELHWNRGRSQLTATTASTTSAELKRKLLNPKLVKARESFTGSDSALWIDTVDPDGADFLEVAAAQTDEINPAPEKNISPAKRLCADLLAILVGLRQFWRSPSPSTGDACSKQKGV